MKKIRWKHSNNHSYALSKLGPISLIVGVGYLKGNMKKKRWNSYVYISGISGKMKCGFNRSNMASAQIDAERLAKEMIEDIFESIREPLVYFDICACNS